MPSKNKVADEKTPGQRRQCKKKEVSFFQHTNKLLALLDPVTCRGFKSFTLKIGIIFHFFDLKKYQGFTIPHYAKV